MHKEIYSLVWTQISGQVLTLPKGLNATHPSVCCVWLGSEHVAVSLLQPRDKESTDEKNIYIFNHEQSVEIGHNGGGWL